MQFRAVNESVWLFQHSDAPLGALRLIKTHGLAHLCFNSQHSDVHN
jgi:hypothetical protein